MAPRARTTEAGNDATRIGGNSGDRRGVGIELPHPVLSWGIGVGGANGVGGCGAEDGLASARTWQAAHAHADAEDRRLGLV
jgi:hypothetical protein